MKAAYIDSSIWITRIEGHPNYRAEINNHLLNLIRDEWKFCISDLILMEVLYKPSREQNWNLVQAHREALEEAVILPVFPEIFKDASKISIQEGIKGIDSIHLSIAVHYSCNLFVSTDLHSRSLHCIQPYWIDIRHIAPQI